MSVDIKAVSGGRPVVWSWCGTCRTGGSNKFYVGVVVRNEDDTFDGICAGGAIGSPPRVYPQAKAVDQETARASVDKQIKTKKKEYLDNPEFLIGMNADTFSVLRASAPTAPQEFDPYFVTIWPMLAPNQQPDKVDIEELIKDPEVVAEEKFNGIRLEGQMGQSGTRYTSRNGGVDFPDKPLEKTDVLPHLNIVWPEGLWGTALDGELVSADKVLGSHNSHVSGALHAKDGRDLSGLVYVVYDLTRIRNMDLTDKGVAGELKSRRELLERVYAEMEQAWIEMHGSLDSFPFVLSYQAKTEAEKRALLADIKATWGKTQGKREGVMFKYLHSVYVVGKRPAQTWIKVKEHIETDVVITGYDPNGKGKFAGKIAAVKFGQYVPAAAVEALNLKKKVVGEHPTLNYYLVELGQASGFSDERRNQFTDDHEMNMLGASGSKFIGKVMKISGMERLKSGAIGHPQFEEIREEGDKLPTDCIWNGVE